MNKARLKLKDDTDESRKPNEEDLTLKLGVM